MSNRDLSFDPSDVLARVEGNRDLLAELVGIFRDEYANDKARIGFDETATGWSESTCTSRVQAGGGTFLLARNGLDRGYRKGRGSVCATALTCRVSVRP
jgi:hypothetical protein